MNLVYLSPVPWASFAQRPHKFVAWFHATTGGDVLWIDPYPTRFPLLSDFRRMGVHKGQEKQELTSWLKVIKPSALPLEPLPLSGWVNAFFWNKVLSTVDSFSGEIPPLLVVGKPSVLALTLLSRRKWVKSLYDAMDDFPAFYSGFSRQAMSRREMKLVKSVTSVIVSSTLLKQRWIKVRSDIQLVHNGLDASAFPTPMARNLERSRKVLGYVGTIGAWFDWDWIVALAESRKNDVVRLIGPVFSELPAVLPKNIEMLPPCSHQAALQAIQGFDVGLIPFKKNDLTASVDPIKFYEYRALGLAQVSTEFGEMKFRGGTEGVYLSQGFRDIDDLVEKALRYRADREETRRFIAQSSWEARFSATEILHGL